MSRFQKQNLSNIQSIFEEKTGLRCKPLTYRPPLRVSILVAAMLALCLMLAAFTYPLFSPLDGDALTLHATYQGNGVVSIQVENHSHKTLKFQPQTKLVKWITGEEVAPLSEAVVFSGTTIAPNSTGTMTVDLSKAYDMGALEQARATDWYYLVLTNDNFVYGQEWKCSVSFGAKPVEEAEGSYSIDPMILSQIEEELRYYFEDDYYGVFAWNPMHYEYLQKVDEYLMRSGKRMVESMYPMLMLETAPDSVVFDETYPLERQYSMVHQNHTLRDEFGKLLGSTEDECFKVLSVSIPAYEGAKHQSWILPLMYFATYQRSEIQSEEDCTFIYGQIVSFAELAPYQVYEDGQFVCYDVTHLIYTDLRTYVESVVAMDPDYYYFDEQCYERIENVWNYYRDNMRMMTWEEFAESRPTARIKDTPDDDELIRDGMSGIVTSDRDIKKIVITIEEKDGETVYSGTFIPTDPRHYDLANAQEASEILKTLESGEYTLSVTVLLDSQVMACQTLFGTVFTA